MRTFVTFVLDETGSMEPIKDDTIGGFNSFVDELRKQDGEILFTLIKFDSNRTEVVHRAEPVQQVPPLTAETYCPGASTPLIDACMKAIQATEKRVSEDFSSEDRIVIAVQTDGRENASREFKNTDLAELVKKKTAEGWVFQFIGAGIDAFSQAGDLGFSAANTMSYGRQNTAQAFSSVGSRIASLHVTRSAASAMFTAQDRAQAGEDELLGKTTPGQPQKKAATSGQSLVDEIEI